MGRFPINKNKFNGIIAEKGVTKTQLAENINLSRMGLYTKIEGRVDFNLREVRKIVEVLEMTLEEVQEVFGIIK